VAGRGLALLDGTSGQVLWRDTTGPEATALPAVVGSRAFVGEADGTLRCRDVATGATRWTFRTRSALEATPLVDLARGRVYLGTTDRRILALDLERGRPAWTWRVGADVRVSGILLDRRVVFAPLDAALYALHLGGNVAWRASLPSRPLSAPLLVDGTLLVACYEDEIVGIDAASGRSVGTLRTAAEIRTAPLLVGRRLVVGLRDRSVVAYALPGETIAP
jgi:outer membrane protein assembly factor BamB